MTKRLLALTLVLTAIAACGTDPKARADKYVASGDSYVAQRKFEGSRSAACE